MHPISTVGGAASAPADSSSAVSPIRYALHLGRLATFSSRRFVIDWRAVAVRRPILFRGSTND
jgi:hypothetical protein